MYHLSGLIITWMVSLNDSLALGSAWGGRRFNCDCPRRSVNNCPVETKFDELKAKCYTDSYPDIKAVLGYDTAMLIDHFNSNGAEPAIKGFQLFLSPGSLDQVMQDPRLSIAVGDLIPTIGDQEREDMCYERRRAEACVD